MSELTKEERRAIRRLEALARDWPPSLWLFSASGTLNVMRFKDNGEKAYKGTGIDPNFHVRSINGIHNDGGDW